jgi:hypothetical protein
MMVVCLLLTITGTAGSSNHFMGQLGLQHSFLLLAATSSTAPKPLARRRVVLITGQLQFQAGPHQLQLCALGCCRLELGGHVVEEEILNEHAQPARLTRRLSQPVADVSPNLRGDALICEPACGVFFGLVDVCDELVEAMEEELRGGRHQQCTRRALVVRADLHHGAAL